jgi:nucleotide-binding universal stress UspA family protein
MSGNERPATMLIALDGSDYALETVKYISRLRTLQSLEINLFTVFSKVPESYWDLERHPLFGSSVMHIRAWEAQSQKVLQDYMEKASKRLIQEGFARDKVKISIREKEVGVARDILKEASQGYKAVAVGRRGASKLKDLVLGSTTTKLLERVNFASLLIVGKNPKVGKVLLGLDGSENAMRAVDYVGQMLGGSGFEVLLLHVIRSGHREYIKEAEAIVSSAFDQALSRLTGSGFSKEQVKTRVIVDVRSRAEAILQVAKEEGYGTIVVGRRGLSKVAEFFMGRVSNKVIQMAKGQAVWVVT